MEKTVEQLTEELRIANKIIAEIKVASAAGQARRESVECDARDLARLTRVLFHGNGRKRGRIKLVPRGHAEAMLSIADRIIAR